MAGSGSALLTKGNVYNHMGNVYNHMATVRGTAAQITSRDTITHTQYEKVNSYLTAPSPNQHGTQTNNVFCTVQYNVGFTGWAYIGTHVQSCLQQTK